LRTVICHFFNEEYLLPWWLAHHREIFDHGVMIDNGSTDRSADICHELVPHWRHVRGRNHKFAAIPQDFEVMQYESEVTGWKIVLNVTEFLIAPHLDLLEKEIIDGECHGSMLDAYIMVDSHPDDMPLHSLPLYAQKPFGFRQQDVNNGAFLGGRRSRFYHHMQIGAYSPGRHHTHWPRQAASPESRQWAAVLWFGLSPWNEKLVARKTQIAATVPQSDLKAGFGVQHFNGVSQIEADRQTCLPFAKDLTGQFKLRAAQPKWRT
jgi:Glycosyl transferase family 2